MQDRQKIRDSPLLSFRRTEYGSSPPSKGDSSNYSRGVYGRWDNRSSGRSDRDSDSQSDRDSGLFEVFFTTSIDVLVYKLFSSLHGPVLCSAGIYGFFVNKIVLVVLRYCSGTCFKFYP